MRPSFVSHKHATTPRLQYRASTTRGRERPTLPKILQPQARALLFFFHDSSSSALLLLSFCPSATSARTVTSTRVVRDLSRLPGPLGAAVARAAASPAVWLRSRRLGRPCWCVGVDVSLILGSRSDKEAGGPHFSLEVSGHAAAGRLLWDNDARVFHNPPLYPALI